MNGFRSLASRTPSSLTAHLTQTAKTPHTAVYRRISSQARGLGIRSAPSQSPNSLAAPTALRSQFLPHNFLDHASLYSRNFHHASRLEAKKKSPVAEKAEPSSESAKKPAEESESSEKTKEEKTAEEEGKDQKEGKKEKKDEPPPPPFGDKSPWQAFKETLQTELKSSEWTESTKALAGEVDKFSESERVRKLREAAASGSNVVADTTSKVFKTTAGAVGKGAAWTWETPAVKAARKSANATGKVMAEVTRPIRESEGFKTIKNVIDDGSSSKYGGWVEKEERRKARELRELREGGGVAAAKKEEPAQEDPKYVSYSRAKF